MPSLVTWGSKAHMLSDTLFIHRCYIKTRYLLILANMSNATYLGDIRAAQAELGQSRRPWRRPPERGVIVVVVSVSCPCPAAARRTQQRQHARIMPITCVWAVGAVACNVQRHAGS